MTRLGLLIGCAAGALAACSNSKTPAKTDAPAATDAMTASSVVTVSCSTVTPAATITTSGLAYSPASATITQGQVVQFVMIQNSDHNVVSTTPNLSDDFNMTDCKMFTQPGTFQFHCSVHGFMGSITVQ